MKLILRLAFVLVLVSSLSAVAQVAEFGVHGGGSLLSNNDLITDAKLTNGFRLGFSMTFNNSGHMGHEFGYAYNRTQLNYSGADYSTAIHQGFYDFLLYATPEGSKIRPFVAGGGQFNNYMFPGYSVTSGGGGSTKFGFNYGAGIKVRVSPMFLIRADVRQYLTPKPDFFTEAPSGWLRQVQVSMGFSFTM
ncbi:MAG: outer membrane beta-barrel protein [Bryobacteraceae bacterium]